LKRIDICLAHVRNVEFYRCITFTVISKLAVIKNSFIANPDFGDASI